jgi:hypothetical protein
MKSNSQLTQDLFALSAAKNKTYIEIGAWKPIHYSNTYLLEEQGWKGFSLEIEILRKELWESCLERKNKIYWEDALTFDYKQALEENNLPTRIGYLSCDIEPPENTFAALQRVIEQGITFDCITFEHDNYRREIDYDPIVTEYLKNHGYKVAVKNVYRTRKVRVLNQKKKDTKICVMETWYVNNDVDFCEQPFEEWISKII